jgi:hypothetical protein
MPSQPLATTAVVLDRTSSGDSWLRLACFSREHGNLACLQRISARSAGRVTPVDLFDELQLELETRNQGRTWFVRDAVAVTRRPALGRSWDALSFACRFARVLSRNDVPDDSRDQVHALLARALTSWETGVRPDSVYFKTLYLFTRDEGYAVHESWWRRLPDSDRDSVDAVLRETPSAQTTSREDTARLIAALESFVRHDTDLRIEE